MYCCKNFIQLGVLIHFSWRDYAHEYVEGLRCINDPKLWLLEIKQSINPGHRCFWYNDLPFCNLTVGPYQVNATEKAKMQQRRDAIPRMGNLSPIKKGVFVNFSAVPQGWQAALGIGNGAKRRGLRTASVEFGVNF